LSQKVVLCGEKLIANRCLDCLIARDDTEVAAIIASETDWQADLVGWASRHNVPVYVGNVNKYRDELAEIAPDFLFSIQYRPLVKEPILRIPTRGCFNLHFGLLPRYGGCYPVAWAILNGEKRAGVTLHQMSPRFDEGDIIAQKSVNIDQCTTARQLFDKLTDVGSTLFKSAYPNLIAGQIVAKPQDITQRLYYSKDSIDFEKDSQIDWGKPGLEVQRRICAFSFEPFQLPTTSIRICETKLTSATVSETHVQSLHCNGTMPGEISEAHEDGTISVKCSDDSVIRVGKLNRQAPLRFLNSLGASLQEVKFVSAELLLGQVRR